MKKCFLFASLLYYSTISAQQVRPVTSAQLYNEVAQLKNLVNVLYLAAHPDDENTRLLAWLVNDQHIRTAYLSLTRGDGGQNILGSEQGAALGLIRTHELMEARKLDGAEQFFTRAVDFGFSKNYEETFKHWDKEVLTGDVVWIYRKYRPDVVICRFPPNERAGHGQHAVSAILAAKAFQLSGDKTQFPDQLQYYKAWQPKRLLWNTYRFGSFNTTSEDQFKMDVGNYSALIGMGYGELAGISRSIHKSQGAGTPSIPGIQKEYFSYVDGDSINESLFDGIDITWNRVHRPEIGEHIEDILAHFNYAHPEKNLKALLELRKEIATVKNKYWREEKLKELDAVILHAAGLMAEITTKQAEAVAGDVLPFTTKIITRGGKIPVTLRSIHLSVADDTNMDISLTNDSLYTFENNIIIPENTPLTQPYWLSLPNNDDLYPILNDTLLGYPETPDNLNAIVRLRIGDESFDVAVPLSYKKLDPVKGDVVEQLRIIPALTLDFTSPLIFTEQDGSVKTAIHVRAFKDLDDISLWIRGAQLLKKIDHFHFKAGTDTLIPILLPAKEIATKHKDDFYLLASFAKGEQTWDLTQHIISYDHLPTLQYFSIPYARVLHKDWKASVKRIGFIEGAGEKTVPILRSAGLQVDILKPADLENAERLKKYDAILTGIRSVNTQKEMKYWMPVLLQYVKNGGTLVMQYNTLQDLSTTEIGPYPMTLSSKRVTEEDATVTMQLPQNKIFNVPNKITDKDFEGWVQERGLYFPDKYDAQYQALFSMHDTGEQPLDGATLYTPYGKGHYIYTALSFFRQLPAGNKGAIRLLMNMLSVGK